MARKVPQIVTLTPEQFEIFIRCSKSPFEFAKYIQLIHPLRGKVPFNLYPFQKATLFEFLRNPFNVILKFRQAGVTELISMFCLWLAMFHPFKNIIIISIKDRVAKKVLRKIKFMYKNLPDFLKVSIVNGRGEDFGTATEIEFSNGSMITSLPTSEDAGRGEAVSLMVIDEAAIVRWAERIWASSWPTLSTGGRAIVNSCVTGDTKIIGEYGNFRIDEICPKEFGVKDISHLGIKVLSHKGKWQRVLQAINKGILETWELKDRFGNIIKCTPDHKFLTPYGWKPAKEVIKNKLRVITYNHGLQEIKEPPKTIPPKIEEFRPIPGFPNYQISNLGKVYMKKGDNWVEKKPQISKTGYHRIGLHNRGKRWKPHVHNLVAEAFINKIPEGYLIDHINCNPLDNYVTNLQIITRKENAQRAQQYSRGLKLGCKIGKGFPNLQLIGLIRDRYRQYGKFYGSLDLIIKDCKDILGINVTRAFVSRIVNKKRTSTVQISKLKVLRKYQDTIYDIQVEEDHSYITESQHVNHNTAYGVGNFFHKLFTGAVAGGNSFNPIRLRWQMHPERDIAWYNSQREILGARKTAQEIDGDFLTSGNTVFDLEDIREIEELLSEGYFDTDNKVNYAPILEHPFPTFNGQLKVFELPQPGITYTLGADISTGRAQDYTALSIMDSRGDEKLCFKGKINIGQTQKLIGDLGLAYNKARVAPESNDIGLGVATWLQDNGYENLYYSRALLKEKGEARKKVDSIPGWYTTKKNRPIIIAGLEEDVRNGAVFIKDRYFCDEAYTFIYDEKNKAVAWNKHNGSGDEELNDENTYTDDAILCKAITNHVRKERSPKLLMLPR